MVRRLTRLAPALGLAALLAVALGCVHQVGLAMVTPLGAMEPGVPSGAPRELPPVTVSEPAPFDPGALLAQPVFAMSRMPPQPAPLPKEDATEAAPPRPTTVEITDAAPPDYILAGIMISGSNQRVLLKKHKTEKGFWVSRGQITGDGWTVLTVNSDKATISRSNSQFTLQFRSYGRGGSQ